MKKPMNRKGWAVLVSLVLILTAAVGTTLAVLKAQTDTVSNSFGPGRVTSTVAESFPNGTEKSAVGVTNTGTVPAYVRAAVVFNWKTDDYRSVLPETPADSDYSITWNKDTNGSKWFTGSDGYYYYTDPVEAGATTENLIDEVTCNTVKTVGDKTYYLSVEILSSAIQAGPDAAIAEWSDAVQISEGKLVKNQ